MQRPPRPRLLRRATTGWWRPLLHEFGIANPRREPGSDDMTAVSTMFDFDNTYARELEELVVDWQPASVPAPSLVVVNRELAEELDIDVDELEGSVGAAVLAGNSVPEGATPVAMVYAGHQFGGFSPRLVEPLSAAMSTS